MLCSSEVGPINLIDNEDSELENKKQTFNDKTDALDKKKKLIMQRKEKEITMNVWKSQ